MLFVSLCGAAEPIRVIPAPRSQAVVQEPDALQRAEMELVTAIATKRPSAEIEAIEARIGRLRKESAQPGKVEPEAVRVRTRDAKPANEAQEGEAPWWDVYKRR